jgi:predicted transposase YdaD
MPYITSIERMGIEKGLQEGRQEGRQEGLQRRAPETLRLFRPTTKQLPKL